MKRSSSASVESETVAACAEQRAERLLAREEHGVGRLAGRFGEGDREAADGEPGGDREQERAPVDQPLRPAGELHDREHDDGGGDGEHDRPARSRPSPGPPNGGSGNGLNDQAAVLKPENEPSPMKTSEPTPAASRPGRSTSGRVGPAEPGRLDHQHGADHRRAEDRRDRREAPGGRHQADGLVGRVALDQAHRERPQPDAERDQRPLRPEHEPEAERRERRQQHSRQVDRTGRRATRLQPVGRHVTAVPGQPHDRERRQQPRERHPRKRPPDRHRVVAEVAAADPRTPRPAARAPPRGSTTTPPRPPARPAPRARAGRGTRRLRISAAGSSGVRGTFISAAASAVPVSRVHGMLLLHGRGVRCPWSPASTRAYGAFSATDSPTLGDVPPQAVAEDGLASRRCARPSS